MSVSVLSIFIIQTVERNLMKSVMAGLHLKSRDELYFSSCGF